MTIIEERPITMAEVSMLVGNSEKGKEIKDFIKKFSKLEESKAIELKKELEGLGIVKLKGSHIVKIADFLPEDSIELNKIVSDASLDSGEIEKVLNVTRKYL